MPIPRPTATLASALLAAAGLVLLTACGADPVQLQTPEGPVSLDIVSGDAQIGVAGTELAAPLKVRAVIGTKKIAGLLVNFRVTAGSGRMFAGASITDREGLAQDYWTLGSEIGTVQRVEVVAVDPTTGAKQTFGAFTARGAASATPKLEATPTSVDFGSTAVGTATATTSVTVTNMGAASASGIAVAVTGGAGQAFEIMSDTCAGATLAFAQTCTVGVRFNPTAEGASTATLAATPSSGSAASVALQGVGLGTPTLGITPPSIDFGSVTLGTSSATQTLIVSNSGNGSTGALATQLSGASANQFQIVTNQCTGIVLAPAATCTISVRFQPTTVGSKSAALAVSGTPGGAVSSAFTGTAVAAQLQLSPQSQDFGYVFPASLGSLRTFSVTNVGNATSGAVGASLSNTNDFAIESSNCATLAPSASCQVVVKFLPRTTGSTGGQLTVNANPGGTSQATLTGTGTGQVLTTSPTSLNFGSVAVGSASGYQPITLINTGNGNLPTGTLSITLAGSNPGDYAIGQNLCAGISLLPGQTCTLQVRFQPTAAGNRVAQLQAYGANGPSIGVSLTGAGVVAAVLSIAPTSHSFGQIAVGSASSAQLFTVSNTGNGTSGTISSVLAGASPSQFAKGSDGCAGQTLAPGATCQVSVTFVPTVGGSFTATLQLSANTGGTVAATLSGSAATAVLGLTPSSQNFGTVPVGSATTPVTFTLSNTGAATSAALGVGLSGANASAFDIVGSTCTGVALDVGATCTIDVRFAPGATGAMVATLAVTGGVGESATASLSGTGGTTAPVITVSPSSATLQAIAGSTTGTTFTVFNTGGSPTSIGFSLSGTDASRFAINTSTCTTLNPGATCSVTVTFSSPVPGTFGAQLNVLSAVPTVVVPLTGQAR